MYTIAGLVPTAQASPVNILPKIIQKTLFDKAIIAQPTQQGSAANLIVFKRPIHSIRNPANIEPIGTTTTIMEAEREKDFIYKDFIHKSVKFFNLPIHDVSVFVTTKSLSALSICGIRMAEKASDIPITI